MQLFSCLYRESIVSCNFVTSVFQKVVNKGQAVSSNIPLVKKLWLQQILKTLFILTYIATQDCLVANASLVPLSKSTKLNKIKNISKLTISYSYFFAHI